MDHEIEQTLGETEYEDAMSLQRLPQQGSESGLAAEGDGIIDRAEATSEERDWTQVIPPPKAPLTAFFVYMQENRARYKAEHPDASISEVTKALTAQWKAPENETLQQEYHARAAEAKRAYQRQLEEHAELLRRQKEYLEKHGLSLVDADGSELTSSDNTSETTLILPVSRVKKLLVVEGVSNVKQVSKEATMVATKAAELFIEWLAKGMAAHASRTGRRTVRSDFFEAIQRLEPSLAFLARAGLTTETSSSSSGSGSSSSGGTRRSRATNTGGLRTIPLLKEGDDEATPEGGGGSGGFIVGQDPFDAFDLDTNDLQVYKRALSKKKSGSSSRRKKASAPSDDMTADEEQKEVSFGAEEYDSTPTSKTNAPAKTNMNIFKLLDEAKRIASIHGAEEATTDASASTTASIWDRYKYEENADDMQDTTTTSTSSRKRELGRKAPKGRSKTKVRRDVELDEDGFEKLVIDTDVIVTSEEFAAMAASDAQDGPVSSSSSSPDAGKKSSKHTNRRRNTTSSSSESDEDEIEDSDAISSEGDDDSDSGSSSGEDSFVASDDLEGFSTSGDDSDGSERMRRLEKKLKKQQKKQRRTRRWVDDDEEDEEIEVPRVKSSQQQRASDSSKGVKVVRIKDGEGQRPKKSAEEIRAGSIDTLSSI